MIANCEFDPCLFYNELGRAVLTLFSALVGALVGLFLLQYAKAWWVSRRLKLFESKHEDWTNLRVWNNSSFSMKDTIIYISVKHKKDDILPGNNCINPGTAALQVFEDRISWSLALDENKHGPILDIHPQERQKASLFWSDCSKIRISSETGLDAPKGRVDLKPKSYDCLIKVVASDMRQAIWEIKIDPNFSSGDVQEQTCRLRIGTYEAKLIEYQKYWSE